jgi:transcriptional regulator with XRE-family HTH domain
MPIRTPRDLAALARGRRLDLGWTQRDLAARAGVSRKWVSDFERGASGGDLVTVLRLLDALGLVLEVGTEQAAPPTAGDTHTIDLDAFLSNYLRR